MAPPGPSVVELVGHKEHSDLGLLVLPPSEYEPFMHKRQPGPPNPGAHKVHEVNDTEPSCPVVKPGGHGVHACLLPTPAVENEPRWHWVQLLEGVEAPKPGRQPEVDVAGVVCYVSMVSTEQTIQLEML